MRWGIAVAGIVLCASCRHKQAPVTPPPVRTPAARPQVRTQAPAQRPVPAPPPASQTPLPEAPPAARAPQELQSSTDAVGDRPAIEARLREVRAQLDALQRRALPAAAAQDRDRAVSMLDLAQRALIRGNLRQAAELSTRAAMLAKTLSDAR